MTSKKATAEIKPLAFANMASRYEKAASILHARKDSDLRDPIYFLYFHAAESALKGFLRSKGKKTEEDSPVASAHREPPRLFWAAVYKVMPLWINWSIPSALKRTPQSHFCAREA
jgi:hypothetical protein